MILIDLDTPRTTFRTPEWLERSFVVPTRRPLRPVPGFAPIRTTGLRSRLDLARAGQGGAVA